MKRLVIVSEESIFAGNTNNGLADVTDGLATSLSKDYEVCVITKECNGRIMALSPKIKHMDGVNKVQLFNVKYYLIKEWDNVAVAKTVDSLKADILHNLSDITLIRDLSKRPAKTIYTIDNAQYVLENIDVLKEYDVVTTVSENYAKELLDKDDELAKALSDIEFVGITNGIDTDLINPASGFLVPESFSITDMKGKLNCRSSLQRNFKGKSRALDTAPVFLVLSRICDEKGIEYILEAIPIIRELGGKVLIYGKGDVKLEKLLQRETDSQITYICEKPGLMKSIPMLAGADFLLYPSKYEPCGLMPLVASRYGTVPIVSTAGGLTDNFNSENAIIIEEDITEAIKAAFELYEDNEAYSAKQHACMNKDFSWKTRKQGYIEIYEK